MIKKGVRQATLMGGVLVLILTLIIGFVLGFIFMQTAVMDNLVIFLLVLAISGLIAGLLTVNIIMRQTVKQIMPLVEALTGPKKK
jgi:ABC-type iron transport system FetAB permease component